MKAFSQIRGFIFRTAAQPHSRTAAQPHSRTAMIMAILMFFSFARLEAQIYGGTQIDISQAPYMVSMTKLGALGHACGGVILNSEWILTAGHCADLQDPFADFVHAGVTDWTSTDGQTIAIDNIILDPLFTWAFTNPPFTVLAHDRALVHLATPLCFTENVQPIGFATPQNTSSGDFLPGVTAFIAGWGDTGSANTLLQGASLPFISNATANTLMSPLIGSVDCSPPGPIDASTVALFQQGIAAGPGDSGGPVIITKADGTKLVGGISSWGGCPRPDFPTIYANVRDFSTFITNTITETMHIYANTTISVDNEVAGDIYVHYPAELVVSAKLQMGKHKRIVVEKGARLKIVSGGILTNGVCGATDWSGIQLFGNSNQNQPNHDAALTNPNQAGIVWIEGGQIDHALLGIKCFGGGQVWSNNGKFFDNQKDVEFLPYKFSPNKSKFVDTRFIENGDVFPNTEGVVIKETNGIEFNRCTFKNKDFEGIRAIDAGVKVINESLFEDNETGVSTYATYPMTGKLQIGQWMELENSFLNNTYHVNASLSSGFWGLSNGQFSLDVINNNFTGGEHGVVVEGASNFRIAGNLMANVKRGGLLTNSGYNAFNPQNFIGCNTFNHNAYFGIATLGENKQVQFMANEFDMNTGGIDFFLENTWFPWLNGAIRPNQGDPGLPAGNCFTNPGSVVDIASGASTSDPFTYFYRTAQVPPACLTNPLNPGNYNKIDVGETQDEVNCQQYGGVPASLPNPAPTDLYARRATLQSLSPQIATNASAKAQYYQTLQEKDAILQYLVEQAVANQQHTTAESLLAGEQSKAADWAIFGLRMNRQDYSGAATWLNQLSIQNDEDQHFRDIQIINLLRLQNPENFALSTAQESFLNTIAGGTSPIRGYARGILGTMKDKRFYPDEIGLGGERNSPWKLAETVQADGFSLFPVPASDAISLTWPPFSAESDAKLTVYDIYGKQYLTEKLAPSESERRIEVGQIPTGLYFLVISDKGRPVHQTKFTIQR